MKQRYKMLVAAFFLIVSGLGTAPLSQAEFVLNASCSSQISEAFQRELLEAFMVENGVKVNAHVFSSNVCLDRLRNGFSNLAGSTLKISQADREAGLIEIPVCKDPMAVISNGQCHVKNLSLKQVRQIFSGSITNWKEVGGKDLPIVLIIPSVNTGAYKNFKDMAMGPFEVKDDLIAGKTFTAVTGVKHIPGAVSFITHAIANQYKDITVINVDGVNPLDAAYPFHQTFYIVVKGEPDSMMKQAIKYMLSDKAKERMIARGMVPVF
ncbi:MAG: substrate-binding domain-containing protein [Proteobacteria bacterium]|nr:substrate-binding domain-containing protein [Pseudomonadota bacterium]